MRRTYTEGADGASERWQRLARRQWEAIRATIPAPWCREAVEIDLEWWRQRVAYDGGTLPSTRYLAGLWGCSQSRAARLLREAGADSGLTQPDSPLTQPDSPLTQPDSAGDEQAAILAAVDSHLTQPDSGVTQPDSGVTQSPEYLATKLPSPAPKKEEGRRRHVQEQAQPTLPLAAPAPAPTKKARASKAPSEEVARVWALYRQHHPRAGEVPPKSWGVEAAVTDLGEQAVLDLVRWAHDSPDQRAQYLRENNYLGETLFRSSKRATYAEQAAQWLSGVGLPRVRQPDQRLPPKEQARARQADDLEDLLRRAMSGERPEWEVEGE